jgi:hypothetical protein
MLSVGKIDIFPVSNAKDLGTIVNSNMSLTSQIPFIRRNRCFSYAFVTSK